MLTYLQILNIPLKVMLLLLLWYLNEGLYFLLPHFINMFQPYDLTIMIVHPTNGIENGLMNPFLSFKVQHQNTSSSNKISWCSFQGLHIIFLLPIFRW